MVSLGREPHVIKLDTKKGTADFHGSQVFPDEAEAVQIQSRRSFVLET